MRGSDRRLLYAMFVAIKAIPSYGECEAWSFGRTSLNVASLAMFSPDKYCRVPIENAKGLIRLLCFEAGQSVAPHTHPKSDEFFYVIEGNGRITIEEESREMEPGSIIRVPAGVTHRWINGARKLVLLSYSFLPQHTP